MLTTIPFFVGWFIRRGIRQWKKVVNTKASDYVPLSDINR